MLKYDIAKDIKALNSKFVFIDRVPVYFAGSTSKKDLLHIYSDDMKALITVEDTYQNGWHYLDFEFYKIIKGQKVGFNHTATEYDGLKTNDVIMLKDTRRWIIICQRDQGFKFLKGHAILGGLLDSISEKLNKKLDSLTGK